MLTYNKLSKNKNLFLRFTGISLEEFDKLNKEISQRYEEYEIKRLWYQGRKKAVGQGNKFKHDVKTRLLMLLIYYKLYVTMDLMTFLFDIHKSNVSRGMAKLEPLVKQFIPIPQKIKTLKNRIKTPEELLSLFPDLMAIVDATEQEINRPQHKKKRDNHYSGKKKKYTRKTQIIVNKVGLILDKPKSTNGKRHDKKLFDENLPNLPEEIEVIGDSGYEGIDKSVTNRVSLPRKKPKGKERPKKDKRFNRKLSKRRIIVENTIRKMKQFGIMGKKYRGRLGDYNRRTDIVTGLVNLRTIERKGLDISY